MQSTTQESKSATEPELPAPVAEMINRLNAESEKLKASGTARLPMMTIATAYTTNTESE